jgi:hypothetical protein
MSPSRRVAATGLVLGLTVWTLFQALMTLAVAEQEEGIGLGCTSDLPKTELIATTAGVGVALVVSIALFWTRRESAPWWTLAVSIGFVVAWVVLGGFDAFDCILGV